MSPTDAPEPAGPTEPAPPAEHAPLVVPAPLAAPVPPVPVAAPIAPVAPAASAALAPSPPAPPALGVPALAVTPLRLDREWPGPVGAAPRAAVAGVAGTAVLAAVVLVVSRPGIGWLLVAAALGGTGIATGRTARGAGGAGDRRPGDTGDGIGAERRGGIGYRRGGVARGEGNGREGGASDRIERIERVGWALAAVLLVGVGTFRADGLLFTWCVMAALACAAIALAGARTLRSLVVAASLLVMAPFRALGWWGHGVAGLRQRRGGVRIGRTVLVTVALVALFGVLFTTADPAFAHFAGDLVPRMDGPELGRGILALMLVGAVALGVAFLAARRPDLDMRADNDSSRIVRRAEWAVPVVVLDALFLAFVLVQLAVLFGGRRRVLATEGLTYAEYARSGFWQLLVVTALTLAVIGVASRVAPRVTVADRVLLRVLLGALTVLTLVIVASALQRITIYDGAFGYTRLRLAVGVIEGWLGLVFLLILVAGAGRARSRWLSRVAAATAVLALLGTAVVGPDRLIAQRNVDRYRATGHIDLVYLSTLSADALPALTRLPDNLRLCAAGPIELRLALLHDDWRSWNLARSRAPRDLIGRLADNCESYAR